MSSRSLAITCLERLMAVERYYESHHPLPAPPVRDAGSVGPDARAGAPDARDRARASGVDRPGSATRPTSPRRHGARR